MFPSRLVVSVLATLSGTAAMAALDPPQSLHISHSEISWDSVDGAAGYNLYRNGDYILTVFDTRAALAGSGEYRVVAFSEGGTHFSPLWSAPPINYRVRPVPAAPVPVTGQKISLLDGDDGDWQAGVDWPEPRFVPDVNETEDINGDGLCNAAESCNGAVIDLLTGLTWLQNADCLEATGDWAQAIASASALHSGDDSGCGLSDESRPGDWRLPNVREFNSLFDYGPTLELIPSDTPFINVRMLDRTNGFSPGHYWTSTPSGDTAQGAYVVSPYTGWVERYASPYPDPQSVWAVRNTH